MPPALPQSSDLDLPLGTVLAADLTLRFGATRVKGRVFWPAAGDRDGDHALALLLPSGPPDTDRDQLLGRGLSWAATAVVLALPRPALLAPDPAAVRLQALGWAAEHAPELGARPDRLLIAGEGTGAGDAARLAVAARTDGWPSLLRLVLVYPVFAAARDLPAAVPGLPAATIVVGGAAGDQGHAYAERLRAAGVDVDELRRPRLKQALVALAQSLREVGVR